MRYTPSNVSSKYGAPMGRRSSYKHRAAGSRPKLSLQRVRLNSGGYDSGGAYWGLGKPLYVATDFEGIEVFVRGDTREKAKSEVHSLFSLPVDFLR
jgi:hypothetical protein